MKLSWKSIVVASICLAMVPQAPAARVVMEPYEGPAVLAYGGVADCTDPVRSMGIACFAVPKGASKLELRVLDESDLAIGGFYFLADASGAPAGNGTFCGAKTILLGDAATVVVRLEAINGPLVCIDGGQTLTAPATQGVIAARLR